VSNRRKINPGNGRVIEGTGVKIKVDVGKIHAADPGTPGAHSWRVFSSYAISDENAAAAARNPNASIHLDMENLVSITGPVCFQCQVLWTPQLAVSVCEGDPS
jgi:hypothetical protein